MFSDELKKTTAVLYKNLKFIGSGVVFTNGGKLYVLTAAHVLYGNAFDKAFISQDWTIRVGGSEVEHTIKSINEDVEFSKTYDVALIELNQSADLSSYGESVKTDPINPEESDPSVPIQSDPCLPVQTDPCLRV